MTKKHFQRAADMIAAMPATTAEELAAISAIEAFCVKLFTMFNDRFDSGRFLVASGSLKRLADKMEKEGYTA